MNRFKELVAVITEKTDQKKLIWSRDNEYMETFNCGVGDNIVCVERKYRDSAAYFSIKTLDFETIDVYSGPEVEPLFLLARRQALKVDEALIKIHEYLSKLGK